MASLHGPWTESPLTRPVRLKFAIGEVSLFSVRLPALDINADVTAPAGESGVPAPPFDEFPGGVELVLVRSQPIDGRLRYFAWTAQSIRYAPSQYHRRCIDLQESFENYLAKFSAKSRHNRRREKRALAAACGGKLQLREFRTSEQMPEFLRIAHSVARTTYQYQVLHLAIPENEEFRAQLLRLAAQDSVRAYGLFAAERPIAFLLSLARHDRLMSVYVGYDPAFARWSPGSVLHCLAIERLFDERRFRVFDFGEGDAAYKEYLSTTSILCADVYYFRRTLLNVMLVVAHCGLLMFSGQTGKLLRALGIKTRVKTFLRYLATAGAAGQGRTRPTTVS